jgi:glycosyltransferase involved in cell wall biosynthesis
VAVEALAAGTPIVSADHPGGQELHALFGEDVAVVPRQDVERLTAALDGALMAPRRVLSATPGLVRRLFSPEAVQSAYEAAYTRAARAAIL